MEKQTKEKAKYGMSRRGFLSTGAAIGAFTLVPNHVVSAAKHGRVAPSDKIRMVHIGCGTEGLSELGALLTCPQIEIVGVADPNRASYDYIYWSPTGLRDKLRHMLKDPNWMGSQKGTPGGREIMKEVVERYYTSFRPGWKGDIACMEDYREMLDKIKDVDAVKIMSPDHLHAYQAIDCLKRGKHIIMHKPLGNKMDEAMKVVDMAKNSSLSTHMMAWNAFGDGNMELIKNWIDAGAIGELEEIHNWTNRPVWPQYPDIPTDTPPIPKDFNWDLWLGPAQMRPYHPHYTHCTFRGWYEFGAGSMADMGYYSLWSVFDALQLGSATSASSRFSRVIKLRDNVPYTQINDHSYPMASACHWNIPYKSGKGSIQLQWHDGGMKPGVPEGYKVAAAINTENIPSGDSRYAANQNANDLPLQGMMFKGTKGAIVSGFNREEPRLFAPDSAKYADIQGSPMKEQPGDKMADGTERWLQMWIDGCRGKGKGRGSFEFAKEVNETFNLGSVSLMSQGKEVIYDPKSRQITNDAEANKLLKRDIRKGWEM